MSRNGNDPAEADPFPSPQHTGFDPKENVRGKTERELLEGAYNHALAAMQTVGGVLGELAQYREANDLRLGNLDAKLVGIDEKLDRALETRRSVRKHDREVREKLKSVSDEIDKLEDTGVRELREALGQSREDKRYWTRWAIGLAVAAFLGATGTIIMFLLGVVFKK